jgi:hypothetical protein
MPGGRTRLIIGGYQAVRPRWIERFVFSWSSIPVVWIMQARTLAVLKRNIERAADAGRKPLGSGPAGIEAGQAAGAGTGG